ncbi:uncharacterized protein RAG0_03842 [Rhynchosporium agropyri]|uniref:C2H2-type domain-containing protein n=1 Tax=Rhynchosporium agropyri TaxID=914238 RepID=A0A1E1KAH2_9HELO|nr:uncharacterized protein RAG0_03842 [Rhynchosporium agropyri]
MLSSLIKLACPVVLLLTLTIPIVAVSTSGSALENVWDIINSTGRVLPAPHIIPRSPIGHINRRDVQLGTHSINLEPGVDFQDCVAAPKCKGMCTFSFIEHSSWWSHAVMHIYDESCNMIGENTHVPRDWMADPRGWGMPSKLPF